MPEMTTISKAELANLEKRVKRLASDKSYLQLIIQLMNKMSAVSGLADTIENMLRTVSDFIGGMNLVLYYMIDDDIYYADVYGNKKKLDVVEDNLVSQVLETRKPIEYEHEFSDTKMMTPEFSKAYTWVVPLLVGSELIGVFKMESLHVTMRELSRQLPVLFSYTALVLKNEILGYTQLQKAYNDLAQEMTVRKQAEEELRLANEALEKRVAERTAELRNANAQLQENEKQITALLDKSEQSRRALLSILEDEQLAEEELSRVNRALRMLSDTNQALIHITDEATLLNDACRIAVEVGGYRMAWVGFAEHDEAKTVRPVAHAGSDSGYIESANVTWADNERGRGPGGTAIRTGQPCMARKITVDPAFAPWREAGIQRGYKSIIALPLISEGQSFGMLGIYAGEADAFDDREVEILKELADDLAFGIIALRTRAKRDQAEEALHESEERYRLIAENTADTITVLDLSLNPIYVSPSVLKLRGYTVQEEMAQSLDQILTPESQQKAKNLFAEQMALESSGKADPARTALIELEEYCKDGSTIWVELAASFLRDNNFKPTGILTVTRNITERKKAEKEKEKLMSQLVQAQKMEAIGTLAGGIAHDFNNILGALIGYTELAIGESWEEKKQHHLEQVLKACDRAKNLVKQILSFSRQHEKELKPIDIGIIAKEALKLLRASLPTTIEIRQRIATVPAMVLADPTWIHQILMNFCTNAAHAMREKGGLLTVSLANVNISPDTPPISPYLQAGHYVQMTVSDTGHGINPAILDRIFDPFFTTKDEGEGTGLGLSVVYGIVNSLGGTITVQSEPGKGAAFDVYLPLIDAGMRREAESISQVLPTGTERILFVDDEESLREIMKAMLQSLGYDVVATSSSEEALKFFLEKPERFDLVITDMTMPHMTGVELAKKLMEMRPGLPIILSTGFSQRISEDKAKDIGIRKFLMKPVSVTDLALSVRGVLDDVQKGR